MTVGQRDLAAFLGRKNFKGIYTRNPLAATPAYAKFKRENAYGPSWPVRREHKQGFKLTNWSKVFSPENAQSQRKPFAQNSFVKSNELIGSNLRSVILNGTAAGETAQQLSFRLGISVPRVEAVVKLAEIRKEYQQKVSDGKRLVFMKKSHESTFKQLILTKNLISKEMKTMAKHMRGLFDEIRTDREGNPMRRPDDLTEIPIPRAVQQQRFLSIAESEPFGPVDAATTLDIEPAATTLKRITEINTESTEESQKKPTSFIAAQHEGDRALFQFTESRVGKVGFRYGAARDDRKNARKVTFLPNGNRVYPLPKSD